MRRSHIIVLIALCAAVASSIGLTVNIAGLFITPMSEALGVGRGSVSLTMTINNLVSAVGGMLFPKLVGEKNFKKFMTTGAATIAITTFLHAFCSRLWMLYALSVLRGFSIGILGTVMASILVNNWFHSHNGLVTSLVLGFTGVSGALLSPLFSHIITTFGWREGFIAAAVLNAVLSLPMILSRVGLTPESVGEITYGETVKSSEYTMPPSKKRISPRLFALCCVYAICTGTITSVVQHFPGVAGSYALPASVGALMISAGMVTNTLGKLILGEMIDHIGILKSVLIYASLIAVGLLSLLFVHTGFAMIAAAALYGLAFSLATVGNVMIVRERFGAANFGAVYSKVAVFNTVFFALGSSAIGYAYDYLHSYTTVLRVVLVFLAGLVIMVLAAYSKED